MSVVERKETTISTEATKLWIETNFKKILREWDNSDGVVESPEEFKFKGGSINSITKKAAAGALRKALETTEIYAFVQNTPRYNSDEPYKVGFHPIQRKELLIAIFPSNFVSRCEKQGKVPEEVLETCLEDLILSDIEAASAGRARARFMSKS